VVLGKDVLEGPQILRQETHRLALKARDLSALSTHPGERQDVAQGGESLSSRAARDQSTSISSTSRPRMPAGRREIPVGGSRLVENADAHHSGASDSRNAPPATNAQRVPLSRHVSPSMPLGDDQNRLRTGQRLVKVDSRLIATCDIDGHSLTRRNLPSSERNPHPSRTIQGDARSRHPRDFLSPEDVPIRSQTIQVDVRNRQPREFPRPEDVPPRSRTNEGDPNKRQPSA
jgi:hypothetical protein